jgi:hypothetical protein
MLEHSAHATTQQRIASFSIFLSVFLLLLPPPLWRRYRQLMCHRVRAAPRHRKIAHELLRRWLGGGWLRCAATALASEQHRAVAIDRRRGAGGAGAAAPRLAGLHHGYRY